MSRHHRRHRRIKLRSLYVWHRYLGLTAALFVLLLAGTGLALNHTERFEWDSRFVDAAWLLDWYGIEAPAEALSFQVGDQQITLLGDRLYLDGKSLTGEYQELIGAIALPDLIAVAADSSLSLFTRDGELVERLSGAQGVPAGMRALGLDHKGRLVIQGGHAIYHPDASFLRWLHWEDNPTKIQWVRATTLSAADQNQLRRDYRDGILPMERVLLDLHSGRILGRYGPLLMDAAAIIMMILAISGFLMWMKRRR